MLFNLPTYAYVSIQLINLCICLLFKLTYIFVNVSYQRLWTFTIKPNHYYIHYICIHYLCTFTIKLIYICVNSKLNVYTFFKGHYQTYKQLRIFNFPLGGLCTVLM